MSLPQMELRILGIDPSFCNFGLSRVIVKDHRIAEVESLTLIKTAKTKNKQVRVSHDDLKRAKELHQALQDACEGVWIAVCEVPTGSQSARSAWSLGIATGILASTPVPLIEVDARSVKIAAVGTPTASKQQMIDWAVKRWPNANWLRHNNRIIQDNEHLADSLAVIEAGLQTDQYKLAIQMVCSQVETQYRSSQ